jgi:hypothetical protein
MNLFGKNDPYAAGAVTAASEIPVVSVLFKGIIIKFI